MSRWRTHAVKPCYVCSLFGTDSTCRKLARLFRRGYTTERSSGRDSFRKHSDAARDLGKSGASLLWSDAQGMKEIGGSRTFQKRGETFLFPEKINIWPARTHQRGGAPVAVVAVVRRLCWMVSFILNEHDRPCALGHTSVVITRPRQLIRLPWH